VPVPEREYLEVQLTPRAGLQREPESHRSAIAPRRGARGNERDPRGQPRFARLDSLLFPFARHPTKGSGAAEQCKLRSQPSERQAHGRHVPTAVTTITKRLSRVWRSRNSGPRQGARSPELDWEHRLETLEARIEHLEAALEGLQDAVHRRAILEHECIGGLHRRTKPDQIARDLSRNARKRGH
jgi:hypothetical protein